MAKYTYGQLEGLWINAGGSTALAPIMAAIAMAESGGNSQATNPNDNGGKQTSWGLWQISNGTHNQPVSGILDPETNAQQAVKKYKSQGLKAWGTYSSGAYKKFLKSGVNPITTGLPTGSTSTATNATPASDSIGGAIGQGFASAFAAIFSPFIEILIWGVETTLGGLLIIAGILIIVANSKEGKAVQNKAEQTVAMAVPEAAPVIAMKQQATKSPTQFAAKQIGKKRTAAIKERQAQERQRISAAKKAQPKPKAVTDGNDSKRSNS